MEFSEVKTILYQSEEIQLIPDKWGESVPFRCVVGDNEYDAFLYWNPTGKQVELKRMIGVCRGNGSVVVLNVSDLVEKFNLQRLIYQIPYIEDYDRYFSNKERYEVLYAKLCSSEDAYYKVGKEEYGLFEKLVGDDLFFNLFPIIAGDFIRRLQEVE